MNSFVTNIKIEKETVICCSCKQSVAVDDLDPFAIEEVCQDCAPQPISKVKVMKSAIGYYIGRERNMGVYYEI